MVIAIAKRARQIMQEEREQDENGYTGITKPVSIAMYELWIGSLKLPKTLREKGDCA